MLFNSEQAICNDCCAYYDAKKSSASQIGPVS